MKQYFELGEFRDKKDEKPLTLAQIRKGQDNSRKMYAHVNYNAVVADLEMKLSKAKKKADKDNLASLLQTAKMQQRAGFGI